MGVVYNELHKFGETVDAAIRRQQMINLNHVMITKCGLRTWRNNFST